MGVLRSGLIAGLLFTGCLAASHDCRAETSDESRVLELTRATVYEHYALHRPPRADDPGRAVTLPLNFKYTMGSAARETWWIRIPFDIDYLPASALALFVPNAAPGAAIKLNGVGIGATADFGRPGISTWYFPLYLHVPQELVRTGKNELMIEMVSPSFDEFRLSAVEFGDASILRQRYFVRLSLQGRGVQVVCVLIAEIGAVSLMLWLRRREETVFGWFALSCGLWVLRNLQFTVIDMISPFDFWVITDAALFWLVAVLYSVSFRILDQKFPRIEAAVRVYATFIGVAMYIVGPNYMNWVTLLGYLTLLPTAIVFGIYLTRRVREKPSTLNVLLWIAAIVTSFTGLMDLVVMMSWPRIPEIFTMPYASLFYAAAVGWALVDRFVRAHKEAQSLNATLEDRVLKRESQLAEQYAASAQLIRDSAITAERDRIVRDMHDGLGLQLVTSKRLAETGQVSANQMADLLSDAIDELRIAIDSMKPGSGDLLVMLGDLRYRLEPRLMAAGVRLEWAVNAIAELPEVTPAEVMEVTRIVQEACTNIVKHARATHIGLSVNMTGPLLSIRVEDDGVGFDATAAARGEGLRNMRLRAERIGATLSVESSPGGTTIEVKLAGNHEFSAIPKQIPKQIPGL